MSHETRTQERKIFCVSSLWLHLLHMYRTYMYDVLYLQANQLSEAWLLRVGTARRKCALHTGTQL